MMRLIDADELLNTPIRVTGKIPLKNGHVQTIEAISVREIENAPTIDLESLRPHGEWKHTSSSADPFCEIWECSCCGAEDENGCCYNYCPNCGARMDKQEESE